MPVTISMSAAQRILDNTFGDNIDNNSEYGPLYYANLYDGIQPASPDVTPNGNWLNQAYTNAFENNFWIPAINGVLILAQPIVFANLPYSGYPVSFIRLYDRNVQPVFDLPIGLPGSGKAAISPLFDNYAGGDVVISTIRMKVATSGNVSVCTTIANFLLNSLINGWTDERFASSLGAASRYKPLSNTYDGNLNISIYSGTIPASANSTATGTLLFSFNLEEETDLFSCIGGVLTLKRLITANGQASGTPSYLRITKAADNTIPTLTTQLPFSNNGTGFTMIDNTITAGVPASITSMSLALFPV